MDKKKLGFGMVFVFLMMATYVSAEVNLWTDINIDYDEQTVAQHSYIQFDDTSKRGIGVAKPIDLVVYYNVQPLPYDLSVGGYAGYVDWCNLTITRTANEYGTIFWSLVGEITGGEFVNYTTTTENYYFDNTSATYGFLEYEMKDKDSLIANFKCHYTDPSSVFVESILFGDFSILTSAYECDECEEYSLEELSDEVARNEEIVAEQTLVYDRVQSVVDMNYQIWIIASWIVKITLIFTAIGLLFGAVYWLYELFKSIERAI